MSKRKGFSLIDVVISVAVLSILITPIIIQTVQTLNTSADSKEKQYVIDNADMLMEFFAKSEIDDINSGKASDSNIKITDTKEGTASCELWVGDASKATIDYSYTTYILEDVQLGRSGDYSRTVFMSDINNQIRAAGYQVNYEVKEDSSLSSKAEQNGFEISGDGYAVIYATDATTGVKYISAIQCVAGSSSYVNPNDVSLGNIQDIDSSTMAIIESDATKLDAKFQKDILAAVLDFAYSSDKNFIDTNILETPTLLNNKIQAFLRLSSNVFTRTIVLSVTANKGADGNPEYYNVTCDVYYNVQLTSDADGNVWTIFHDVTTDTWSGNHTFKYTVLNQDYYTSEPPDVYMMYEPFIRDTTDNSSSYAETDYLCFYGDEVTTGTAKDSNGNLYDPTKIYLIKSEGTWGSTVAATTTKTTDDDGNEVKTTTLNIGNNSLTDKELEKYSKVYFTVDDSGHTKPVSVNVNQLYSSDDSQPFQIITNVSVYTDSGTHNLSWDGASDPYKIKVYKYNQYQFDTAQASAKQSPNETSYTRRAYPSTIDGTVLVTSDGTASVPSIVTFYDESNYDGRLFGITVMYTNKQTQETTYFTGAKGAD